MFLAAWRKRKPLRIIVAGEGPPLALPVPGGGGGGGAPPVFVPHLRYLSRCKIPEHSSCCTARWTLHLNKVAYHFLGGGGGAPALDRLINIFLPTFGAVALPPPPIPGGGGGAGAPPCSMPICSSPSYIFETGMQAVTKPPLPEPNLGGDGAANFCVFCFFRLLPRFPVKCLYFC